MASSSMNATISPEASAIPVFRAGLMPRIPLFSATVIAVNCARSRAASARLLSLTTIISYAGVFCCWTEVIAEVRISQRSSVYVQMITDMFNSKPLALSGALPLLPSVPARFLAKHMDPLLLVCGRGEQRPSVLAQSFLQSAIHHEEPSTCFHQRYGLPQSSALLLP